MDQAHRQRHYDVRFDWGTTGAKAVAADADVAVVVDVLSFTTTLSVAVDAGIAVLPYRWNDATARGFADQQDAVLALGRSEAGPGEISLSPATIRSATPPQRLVLPSPNGSTIAFELGTRAGVCVGACLRNAQAVAGWISSRHAPGSASVAVIAAGERWPSGDLRPAVEDLWGTGAVIAGLKAAGWFALSPEAELAVAGYEAIRGRELIALSSCASGRELTERGFGCDVEIAAEVDGSAAVPVLVGRSFIHQ
jgi:2-phosphosulfolactate phosphatase